MAQYCQNCGSRLNGGEAYCPRCQKPVTNGNDTPAQFSPTPAPPSPAVKGGMGKAIKTCFGKYSDFSGRATRSEYWWFALFCGLVGTGLTILKGLSSKWAFIDIAWQIIRIVWQLGILLPSYAVIVRRIHDTGRSGWLSLWTLPGVALSAAIGELISVPDRFVVSLLLLFLGTVYLLSVLCNPTQSGSNRFGPEPEPF